MNDLYEQRDTLRTEIEQYADRDDLTDDDEARFDEALAEFETVQAQIAKHEERQAKIDQVRQAPVRQDVIPASPTVMVRSHKDIFDLTEIRTLEPKAANAELRARALDAIELAPQEYLTHDGRETATRHAQKNPRIAEHILRTGSPAYHEAFEDYMVGAPINPAVAEQRAAMSLTNANGGFLVPFTLDPTIILTNTGSENPFRAISRVETITTDDWNGVSSAGVSAEWLAEATEAADASPTFAQPSITVHKAAAYVQASIEVVQDSGIAGEIGMLIADAKNRLEATAFATGSGSSQPFGIVTALGLTTTSRTAGSSGAAGAADLVAADIYALDTNLPPRHRDKNPAWVGSRYILNEIRKLGTTNNFHAFWVDFGGGMPPNLIGYPVYQSSAMDTTVVSGSNDDVLILGDWSQYVIVDRVGMSIAYNPLVLGSNRRPSGEVGWFAYWRVGADSVNDAGFQMLRL